MNNRMLWVATYANGLELREDNTIPDHWLTISGVNLKQVSYIDGMNRYSLYTETGLFGVNDSLLTLSLGEVAVPIFSGLSTKPLSPSQEELVCGIFQYKHCSNDCGSSSFLGTYNLGYLHKHGSTYYYCRMSIDSSSGSLYITVKTRDSNFKVQKIATSKLELGKTRALINGV